MNKKVYCAGIRCPVRERCLRYTKKDEASVDDALALYCTNQKKFIQDSERVVKGR